MQNQTDFKSWTRVQWRSLNPNQFNFEGWNHWENINKKTWKKNNKKNEDKIWEKKKHEGGW
jgi:hypothetical protein